MAAVQAHPAGLGQHVRHARQRPQIVEETMCLGALLEQAGQLHLVGISEFGRGTQRTPFPSRPAPASALGLPLADGRTRNAQSPRNLGLGHLAAEQFHAFTPTFFQHPKNPVSSSASFPSRPRTMLSCFARLNISSTRSQS